MVAVVDTNVLVRARIRPRGTVTSVLVCLRKGAYTVSSADPRFSPTPPFSGPSSAAIARCLAE